MYVLCVVDVHVVFLTSRVVEQNVFQLNMTAADKKPFVVQVVDADSFHETDPTVDFDVGNLLAEGGGNARAMQLKYPEQASTRVEAIIAAACNKVMTVMKEPR
jgi:hypothetical protein